MTPLELLSGLRGLGVRLTLTADGEHIDVDAPTGVVTEALRQALGQHKDALLTILEWFEERAGILEYEAGLSRAEAEREAWTQMEERYAHRPPSQRKE